MYGRRSGRNHYDPSATVALRRGFLGVRGPGTFGLGMPLIPHQHRDADLRQGPLLLRSHPDLPRARAGTAVRVLEFGWQRRHGRRGAPLGDRGLGLLRAQGVVDTTLGAGPQPRGDPLPMPPEQGGNLVAVACLAAGGQERRPGAVAAS
jgi:hypothetical protein